jgi:DNA-binding NarL/FixJ family response regulator
MPIRIVLVDDHALVRQGFRRILEDDAELTIVGEAGNGLDAVTVVKKTDPDVVVMDMAMPEMNGLHATMELVKQRPGTKILILSMYSDEQYVRNALDAGVKGYILKNAIETDLTRAVRAVAGGEQYLSPELSGVLIRAIQTGSFDGSSDPYDKLTQREKEIAVLLDLSVNTVAVHRANLMSTLGVHKTAELVLFAVKKGLVLPE